MLFLLDMRKRILLLILTLSIVWIPACAFRPAIMSGGVGDDVSVYGIDDRVDVGSTSVQVQFAAKAVGALIRRPKLFDLGPAYDYNKKSFQSVYKEGGKPLCEDENFRDQNILAFCTGFLIAPNLMLTAGHCIKTQADCDGTQIAFDFETSSEKKFGPDLLAKKNTYGCKNLIAREYFPYCSNSSSDYLIKQKHHRPKRLFLVDLIARPK